MSLPGRTVVLLACCLTLALVAAAAVPPSPWAVRVWTCRGVADRTIIGVAQTPDGFLWFATPRQLARFDGARLEVYGTTDVAPVQNQRNRVLLETRDGALWLATDSGQLVRFGPQGVTNYSGLLPRATPDCLVEGGDGSIWISFQGTPDAICQLKDGRVTRFSVAPAVEPLKCLLACDRDGNVWYAHGAALGYIRDGVMHELPARVLTSARMVGSREGGVWIAAANGIFRATADGRVHRIDSDAAPFSAYPNVMLEDRSGGLWIGTSPDGLFHYTTESGLERIATSYPEIISLAEDREGNIWAGTSGSGVDCISPRAISVEGDITVLPQSAIQSVAEDTDNVIWGCTQNGTLVQRTPAGGWRTEPGWPGSVTVITPDPRGGIWIGTRKWVLHRMVRGVVESWPPARGLASHTVSGITLTPDGTVWLTGEGPSAIQSLRNGQLITHPMPPTGGRIESMTADAAGRVWFGLGKGRLLRTEGNRIIDATPAGKPNASVRALHALPDGTLWLGYRGGGLGRLRDGRFTHFSTEEGLFSNSVVHLISDERGWLWCAGEDGIFKVRLQALDAFAAHQAGWVQSVRYGPEAGLPNLQVTAKTWGSALRTHDGRIWIPMSTALVIANPARAPENAAAPPVFLTSVRADGRTVAAYRGVIARASRPASVALPAARTLRLPPVRQRLEFDFTALSFTAPENVQFRYRLEPFDDDWVTAGPTRTAAYAHVPGGDYRFRLQACNSDGVWNETGASLAVTIAPFTWQTWWFRALVVLAFTAVTTLIVRRVSHRRLQRKVQILRQQMALEKERSRIARDLHDDAGNRLTRIALLSKLALRDRTQPDRAASHLEQLSVAAREATDAFDEIVWAVNPHNDTLGELVAYLAHFAQQFCAAAAIDCVLDVPVQVPERTLETDVRHNLFLATKEAIHNAIRHAGATELRLTITITEEKLTIVVADNGRGLPAVAAAPGADGLRNFRLRMEEIGGEFDIESAPYAGTRLTFGYAWTPRESRAIDGRAVL